MQTVKNKSLIPLGLRLRQGSRPALNGLPCAMFPTRGNFYTKMPGEKTRRNKGTEPVDILPPEEVIFGRSFAMQQVRRLVTRICSMNVPVLLNGSGGTGKEVLARWIHKQSPASTGQFVKVNCAAIPGSLLESELFGYEKGAFTGAHASKPGRVELAHNGTLFLDEIADLGLDLQCKLLQFLQDGRFSRIGDESERVVEARLICATSKNLDWPGNIRELSNGIARHVLIGAEAKIVQEPEPKRRDSAQGGSNLAVALPLKQIAKEAVRERENRFILEALQANQWNRRRAAQALKISYRALIYKIRNAGLLARRVDNSASRRENPVGPSHSSAD